MSKYGHFILLKHLYTARTIAVSIVSNREPLFLSLFWKEIFRLQGTQLHMSTTYYLETDRQTKVFKRATQELEFNPTLGQVLVQYQLPRLD